MKLAVKEYYRLFTLHIRCENCLRETTRLLDIPPGDDAPQDTDELLESGFLSGMQFCCNSCESQIGRLFGISYGEG
jgi:hypothetical protein